MARIVMIGAGMVGVTAATLLQQDGHRVTVLERDPAPPPPPECAWDTWLRRGVPQLRLPHALLARFAQLVHRELPTLFAAFLDAGALGWNPIDAVPAAVSGGRRPGDDRFVSVTGRRPLMEAVVATHAELAGVDIRRGVGACGLTHERGPDGTVHVTGVVADTQRLRADLVVDCSGRRSPVAGWLRELGSPGPVEDFDDSGFVYYARHYRSADRAVPALRGPVLQPYGSITIATLPADAGTWSVVIYAAADDAALRPLADSGRWEAVVRAHPLAAHWIDAEPMTGIDVFAKIEDRQRSWIVDGEPVATGIVPLGDAWACTSPSLGRGISLGAMHAVALRDALRTTPPTDRREFVETWQALTDREVGPYVRDTVAADRQRLAEMRAAREGRRHQPDDPTWGQLQQLARVAGGDPELFRATLDIAHVLRRASDVLGRPGIAERAAALPAPSPAPVPDRGDLLDLAVGLRG